ncbi:polyamine-modulated factor 1-binding protein 1 isoform X2 [Anolis sagrei]|uniref:polyamine-modulated factor 1-binding protein 1 isoform X2 n=1 Tax=Anolis sagrei TaxID=38937 RepID=UPI003521C122
MTLFLCLPFVSSARPWLRARCQLNTSQGLQQQQQHHKHPCKPPLPVSQMGPDRHVALQVEDFLFRLGPQLQEAIQLQDAAKAELAVREQRTWESGTRRREAQAVLDQRRHQSRQPAGDPEAGKTHQEEEPFLQFKEEPCRQLTSLAGGLNEAWRGLRWGQRLQALEDQVPSQTWGSCVEGKAGPLSGREGGEWLGVLHGERSRAWAKVLLEELHDAHLLAQGAMAQLAVAEMEAAALRSKYRLALEEAAESNQALQSLRENHDALEQSAAEKEMDCGQLESQAPEQLEDLCRAQDEVQQHEDTTRELQDTLAASQEEVSSRFFCTQEGGIKALQRKGHLKELQVWAQQQLRECGGRGEGGTPQGIHKLRGSTQSQLPFVMENKAAGTWGCWEKGEHFWVEVGQGPGSLPFLLPLQVVQQKGLRSTEQHTSQGPQEELGALKETLQEAREQQSAGKEPEVTTLQTRLHHLQDKQQEPRMVEQTGLILQLQHEQKTFLRQSPSTTTHSAGMEELQVKLQHLQEELDICKGRNQENLSKLQARESTMEEQSLDLDHLLQQCQALKEKLVYYEEVAQKQELTLAQQHQRERHLQERLAQAEGSTSLLEESLAIYKQKYQASLARTGELESRLQRLEEELANQAKAREEAILKLQAERIVWQEELEGKCHQASCTEEAMEQLARELSQSRQVASQFEESIRGLQQELTDSRTKLLGQEGALAALQRDFASYKATHSCSNSSYENQMLHTEALQQRLQEAIEESAEHQQEAKEYRELVQDLKLELVRVAEQKGTALKGLERLELTAQSLRLEVAAERERRETEAGALQQQAQQLELELRQSRQACAQQEQAVRKRDEVLHKSQVEMLCARSALQEKGQELEQQRAHAHRLEAGLKEAHKALEESQAERATLRSEAKVLRQNLRESQERHQQAAQELVRQEEQLLLAQNSLRTAQEHLEERVAEVVLHSKATHRLEAEVQALSERAARAEDELQQKSDLIECLTEELSQSRRQHQAVAEEAQQQRQAAARMERKLEGSREGLRSLQQQVQGHESVLEGLRAELGQQKQREEELKRRLQEAQEREGQLAQGQKDLQRRLQSSQCQLQEAEWRNQGLQLCVAEREAEGQALREKLKHQVAELEAAHNSLDAAQLELQQQATEALRQEAALAQLRSEFRALQEQEKKSHQALLAAQELKAQAACCQSSQREAMEKLEQKTREASCLQAELQLAQHKTVHLEEQIARTQAQLQELLASQRERQQEVCRAEERLQNLGLQAQRWQKENRAAQLTLEEKDEELVVAKVELAAAEERWRCMAEERDELQNEANLLRQKFVVSSREVESLQTSLEAAQSDSRRLQHESELVMANVSQWVTEQKKVNEKLGCKIRDQIKHMAQLTGERDHLQGLTQRLEQENKRLKNEADDRRIECERLKALRNQDLDSSKAWQCSTFPVEGSPRLLQRKSQVLATEWNRP